MDAVTKSEIDSLLPEQKYDRRNFLVTSACGGVVKGYMPCR